MKTMLPARVRDVEVVLVENCGHYVAEEQPEALIAHLTAFLG